MITRAEILWHDKEKSWFEPTMLEHPANDQVMIRALYSMVSQGSERRMLSHDISEQTAERMAVPYMEGTLDQSFTYGYSLVGEIIEGDKFLIGKKVHLLHPHQDYLLANTNDLFELPDKVEPRLATLTSNLETVVNAIWDGELTLGDRVLILGYGLVGSLLATMVSRMPGIHLEVLDTDEKRSSLASAHGHNLYASGSEFNKIFNTSGHEKALQHAIDICSQEGTIIEMSWYGSDTIKLNLGADFHYGRKRIISSQVSEIPYSKQPEWNHARRKKLVFELLESIPFDHLISSEVPYEEAPTYFDKLRKNEINELSTIITYQ